MHENSGLINTTIWRSGRSPRVQFPQGRGPANFGLAELSAGLDDDYGAKPTAA